VAFHGAPKRDKSAFRILIHRIAVSRKRPFTVFDAQRVAKEQPMLDLILLAIGLGFFALSVGYTIACDRL
jgi:hypothetical protein